MSRSPGKLDKKRGSLIPAEELKALGSREPWLAPVCQRLGELTEAGFGSSFLAYQLAEYIKAAIRACEDADVEAALRDPSCLFGEPQDVASHPKLSRENKLAILRRWEQDALRLSASEAEGMGGGQESMLGRVEQAIQMVLQK